MYYLNGYDPFKVIRRELKDETGRWEPVYLLNSEAVGNNSRSLGFQNVQFSMSLRNIPI